MTIPGLSTIKTWVLAGLAIISAVLYGLLQTAKLGREKDRRKSVEKSIEVKDKATAAIIEGNRKKQEARREDDSDMSHFGS